MSNSSGCPRIFSGVNRTLIVLLVIVVLEFMVVRWYYTKPDLSRQKVPIIRGPYLNKEAQRRGLTPDVMTGIDYAVSQIKTRMADKEHSGFRTWPERPLQDSQIKLCEYYNDVAKAKRIVMKNVLKTPLPNQRDVTIVTQTRLDRLDLVKRLLDHWEGPVSLGVHVRPAEMSQLSYYLVSLAINTPNLQRLAMHLVFDLAPTDNYPINYLRDVAFNSSRTDRLFLLDVDFVTSKGLHNALKYCDLGYKEAVVVPAFHIDQQRNRNIKIEDTEELKTAWRRRIVRPFKSREFPQGHRATRYSQWRVATRKYKVAYELLYEPYVLVQKGTGIPHYDPRFMNADWDRSSHIYALKRSGYTFTVLPKAFVLNYPDSPVRTTYGKYKECSRAIWARVTNTKAMKSGNGLSVVKWKGEDKIDSHKTSIGQQRREQSGHFGQRGEEFGQRSEQFGKGQKGKTNDIGLGIKQRKPYFSEIERLRDRQNATNVKIDGKEGKPTRSEMEKIIKTTGGKYNKTVGGEGQKPIFSERGQVGIITTDVKSDVNGRKSTYSEMIQKKKESNMQVSKEKERSPFSRMKQDPNARSYMKTLAQESKLTQLEMEQIKKRKENTMKVIKQQGRPAFSKNGWA